MLLCSFFTGRLCSLDEHADGVFAEEPGSTEGRRGVSYDSASASRRGLAHDGCEHPFYAGLWARSGACGDREGEAGQSGRRILEWGKGASGRLLVRFEVAGIAERGGIDSERSSDQAQLELNAGECALSLPDESGGESPESAKRNTGFLRRFLLSSAHTQE